MAKISVILPTYNGGTRGEGKYLKQAIESVLSQTYENFELIIVNDGSTDNTEEIIKQYKDSRIIYLKHNVNKGPAAARNTGLNKANGEYIAFVDDDDYYYKNKLEEQLKYMIDNNALINICESDIVYNDGNKIGEVLNINKNSYIKDICALIIHTYPTSIMIYRDVLKSTGYFKEYLRAFEDWDYILRTAIKYEVTLLHKKICAYRLHTLNITSDNEKMYINGLFIKHELLRVLLPFYNNNTNEYNADFFSMWMQWKYSEDNFILFRRYFKIALLFNKLNIKWHLRYYLSYFPLVLFVYRKIKKCIKYR